MKRCSICDMWRSFAALLLMAAPVCAQENATAYEALRVVGAQFGRGALNHVVSIAGVKGDPQPEKWKIILEDADGRAVRELEIVDGKINSDERPDRSVAGSTEGATIQVSRLNLDSSGAFAVASHIADTSHTQFATADYTLRTDERGEPIWHTRSTVPISIPNSSDAVATSAFNSPRFNRFSASSRNFADKLP